MQMEGGHGNYCILPLHPVIVLLSNFLVKFLLKVLSVHSATLFGQSGIILRSRISAKVQNALI